VADDRYKSGDQKYEQKGNLNYADKKDGALSEKMSGPGAVNTEASI
jgi:hypothetical protein